MNRTYGFTFFPDEFGYWSYAAGAAGYDWSDITALGSYYSYGYSLILFPIFVLFQNGVAAYRAAVTLNFILLALAYFLLLKISRNELYTAAAILYPSCLFYARSTMAEVPLAACFLLCCFFLQKYRETRKIRHLAGCVLSLVYCYFLHMRAVGVLVAGMFTLAVIFLRHTDQKKRNMAKHIIVMILVASVLLMIGFFLKKYATAAMYTASDETAINDYSGQLEKLRYFFTKDGLRDGIFGLAGKLLYTGVATFGLAWFGIIRCVKKVRNSPLHLFILLSFLAETAISALFNIRPLRVDSVVYGRYHEFIFPILIVLGLSEPAECKKPFRKTAALLLMELPLTWMAVLLVDAYDLTNIHGYVMVGMSCLHGFGELTMPQMLWLTYLLHVFMTLAAMAVTVTAHRRQAWHFLLLLLGMAEIALSMLASAKYIDDSARGAYRDTVLADTIRELRTDNADGRLIYIRENDDEALIGIMQFLLREEDIVIITREEYAQGAVHADDLVLTDYRSDLDTRLAQDYRNSLLHGHFALYYNTE